MTDITLLYKIAKAYYEDGLTQDQIGKRFGLSRIKVSRLLAAGAAEPGRADHDHAAHRFVRRHRT